MDKNKNLPELYTIFIAVPSEEEVIMTSSQINSIKSCMDSVDRLGRTSLYDNLETKILY